MQPKNYTMNRYVKRGFEDKLIDVLKSGNACILGLTGMGKTTTARYIYVRLKREVGRVVYLTHEDVKVEFRDEEGNKEEIYGISLRNVWKEKKEDEVEVLAHAVVVALNGTLIRRLSEKGEKALGWIIQKFGSRRLEKAENLHIKIRIEGSEIGEAAKRFYEWFKGVFGDDVVKKLGEARITGRIEKFLKSTHENILFKILLDLSSFNIFNWRIGCLLNH